MKNQTTRKEFEKIFRNGGFRYSRPAVLPQLLWIAIRSAIKLLPGEPVERLTNHLFPKNNPGSGIFRGRQNIAKSVTYRATYVPGGFNQARDARREAHRRNALDQENAAFVASCVSHTIQSGGI